MAALLLALVVAEGAEGHGREKQDGDEVDPCHHANPHVAQTPDDASLLQAAEEDGSYKADAQDGDEARFVFAGVEHLAVAVAGNCVVLLAEILLLGLETVFTGFGEEVDEACFGVIIIGHHRGEGKEEEGDGDDHAPPAAFEQCGEGRDGVLHAGKAQLRVGGLHQIAPRGGVDNIVAVRGQQHHRRGCADKQRVHIDGEALHKALLHGVVHLGRRRNDGGCALSGLIAVDAPFHAPRHCGTHNAAQGLMIAKRGGKHGAEGSRHRMGVGNQHHHGNNQVGNGHEGSDNLGHLGNALHAPYHHQCDQCRNSHANHPWLQVECGGEGHRDAVAVDGRQTDGACHHRGHGKDHGQPRGVETFLDIVSRATAQLVAMVLLVDLCQTGLRVCRPGTEESDNPHPHHRTGAAEPYGQRHPYDVARSHAAGQRKGKGLERRDARALRTVVLEEQTDHLGQMAHLHKARAEGEIEGCSKAQTDQWPAPYVAVEHCYNLVHKVILFEC